MLLPLPGDDKAGEAHVCLLVVHQCSDARRGDVLACAEHLFGRGQQLVPGRVKYRG